MPFAKNSSGFAEDDCSEGSWRLDEIQPERGEPSDLTGREPGRAFVNDPVPSE